MSTMNLMLERKMLKNLISRLCLFCVFVAVASVSEASAQAPGYVGVEGQITDVSTGRPLGGAMIILRQTRPSDGLVLRDFTVVADSMGFYQIEDFQVAETYPTVVVTCLTSKGNVVRTLPLYSTLKDQSVYVRNAALTLPKRATRCLPPTPAGN